MRSFNYSLLLAGISTLLLLAFLWWWLWAVYHNRYTQLQQELTLRLDAAASQVERDFFESAVKDARINGRGDTIIFIRTGNRSATLPPGRTVRTFTDRHDETGSPRRISTQVRIVGDSLPSLSPLSPLLPPSDSLAAQLRVRLAAMPWPAKGATPGLVDLAGAGTTTAGMLSDTLRSPFLRDGHYALALAPYRPLLLRRMQPEMGFAALLFSCVVMAFYFGERNRRRQHELIELKNDFIGNITHELKTPITTVGLTLEALERFGADADPDRRREYLQISQHELQRLQLLVDRVLHLARFDQGHLQLTREPVALDELVSHSLAALQLQLERQAAQVSLHTEGEDFRILADPFHLTNVVFNLIDNALKYSVDPPRIRVHLRAHLSGVELAISDSGIGIPAAYHTRIFEKFFRVPQGDVHNTKGHGLGLSYVAHIIGRLGGHVRVSSPPTGGTTFTIRLPRYPAPA